MMFNIRLHSIIVSVSTMRVHTQFVDNGIGVICGEYGLLGFDKALGGVEHGEVLKYFEHINYYAKQKDITMMFYIKINIIYFCSILFTLQYVFLIFRQQ